jgi:hypothetical protein
MLAGNFERAWDVSDAVLQRRLAAAEPCTHWPRHLQYVWDGTPLAGKRVLVRCYHGLGDTIQFVRLLEPLHRRARHVTLWAQPALLGLLQSVRGIDRLLPLHDGVPPSTDHEVDVELMELPHALRLTPGRIPTRVPYIYVARAPLPASRESSDNSALKVGLAWRSGDWLPQRSLPDEIAARLAVVRHVQWYSLQYDADCSPVPATKLACRDISTLAARMRSLDLVISTDTMTAHLAGALGLPTWTLLPAACDWRWMSEREDSPWYPTMRLFRQQRAGDWSSVISSVIAALDSQVPALRARDIRSAGCTGS